MKRMIIVFLCIIAFAGCDKRAEEVRQRSNPNVQVKTLFSHDGCTVYRFYDGGRYHYFSKCADSKSQTISVQGCGKNCIRDEIISSN